MAAVLASRLNQERNAMKVVPVDDELPNSPGRQQEEINSHIAQWGSRQVASWLEDQGRAEVAQAARNHRVNGAMLLELDTAAWAELGVTSALERARLISEVKQAAAVSAATSANHTASSQPVTKQDFLGGRTGKKNEAKLRDHFTAGPPCCSRTPAGGAEHTSGWVLSIANANSNPAEVKQHFLRFMGMYNVIDLLVLTINMSYLIAAELSAVGPSSWTGVVITALMSYSATLAGVGMGLSTIIYNTASAVSDANFIVFCKMPQTIRSLRAINDLSIWSGNFTTFTTPFFAYRICVELIGEEWTSYPGQEPYEGRWYYACAGWILPLLAIIWNFPLMKNGVFSGTHAAMYGGLMSSQPIAPLAEDPTWAHRCSSEQIAQFVASQAVANGQPRKPRACENGCATMYADSTVAWMTGQDSDALDAQADGTGLLSSLASIITLVSATRKVSEGKSAGMSRLVPGNS